MDHGVVDAELAALVERFVLEVIDRVGKAHAERQMAAGVLVKKRVVKQNAGLVDGRVERHQRALAEIRTSLVHFNELRQKIVVFLRVPLDGFSLVEANPEAVNELRLVGKGLRGIDDALGFSAHRGDEALLRRNVRVKDNALQALFRAAAEACLRNHADMKIRTVGCLVMKLADVQAVEVRAPVVQILIVRLPRGNGVFRDAGGRENRLPELFDCLAGAQVREELLCPLFAGHCRDAPLVFVFDLVAVALDDRVLLLLRLCHLLLIDALEPVGVFRNQVNPAGNGVDVVLPARLLVVIELRHCGQAAVAHVKLVDRLMAPVDDDLLCLQLIAFLDQHRHELRLVQLCLDEDLLPLLNVDAAGGNELRVGTKNGFFHSISPQNFKIIFVSYHVYPHLKSGLPGKWIESGTFA